MSTEITTKSRRSDIDARLDKFRAHLIDNVELSERDRETLAKYRKAHGAMCLGYSVEHVRGMLEKEFGLSESRSYAIIQESIKLYGDVMEVDKAGMKKIFYENYMLAANLARQANDYKSMTSALDKAAALLGLNAAEMINPHDFAKPVAIVFTTDAQVLKTEQTEDADYEQL